MSYEDKDYYSLLGLTNNATHEEIKAAYKKLALIWHPDRNKEPGAEEIFKMIAEAYEVLSNPEKKLNYDRITQPNKPTFSDSRGDNPFDLFNSDYYPFFSDQMKEFLRQAKNTPSSTQSSYSQSGYQPRATPVFPQSYASAYDFGARYPYGYRPTSNSSSYSQSSQYSTQSRSAPYFPQTYDFGSRYPYGRPTSVPTSYTQNGYKAPMHGTFSMGRDGSEKVQSTVGGITTTKTTITKNGKKYEVTIQEINGKVIDRVEKEVNNNSKPFNDINNTM
jgi:curved DNA-binding protein CbpA